MFEDYQQMIDMELHTVKSVNNFITALRVPTGWIYTYLDGNGKPSHKIFVPERVS